jgi:hypothetical protein
MIVLDRIDLTAGSAQLWHAGMLPSGWVDDFWRIVEAGRSLQLQQVSLCVVDGEMQKRLTLRDNERLGRSEPPLVHLVRHSWELQDGLPVYDGSFHNSPDCLPQLSRYAGSARHVREQRQHLAQLRIAIYDLRQHHRARRAQRPARIDVHLQFLPEEIRGWVQDTCQPFDPSRIPETTIAERLEKRSTRGYGLTIMRLLLDTMEHEFNPTGNRITFSKRILQ